MKRLSLLLLISLAGSITFQSHKSPRNFEENTLPEEVVASINKRVNEGITPSIAIAMIDAEGVQYFNFGKTSKDGPSVDENTIYEIGSISKVFTGILLAQQVLDGNLQLDDPINNYLPDEVKVPVKGDQDITFGHLTDHTSGLPRLPTNMIPTNPLNPYADYTVDQMYLFISSYQPTRKVGAAYEYSNLAQGLLGHLLALNQNTSYEELMIQTIADPLQMTDTRIQFTESMQSKLALPHSGNQVVQNWDIPTLAGAGAIRSNTKDMAQFISANLGYVDSPLKEAMEKSHQQRHKKAGAMGVGMAWHIKKGKDGDVIWHNGGTGGYRTFAGFVKETGKGVVVLTNSTAGADDIGFHLLDPGSPLQGPKTKSDAIEMSESTLEQYVGVYELQPQFKIAITREGTQLYGQATGQSRFELYPETETLFYITVVKAQISFQVKDQVVESLTLFQGGQEIMGKKIE